MDDLAYEYARYLKGKRKKLKMTQKEFCELIGVSINTLINYENGHSEPSKTRKKDIDDIIFNLEESRNETEIAEHTVSLLLENLNILAETYKLPNDKSELLKLYDALNASGKTKAREYLQDLAGNSKYTLPEINEQ